MVINFLWLAFYVLIAYTTQAMTGFGSVIIAVTLGSNLYPLEFLLPIMVPLDVLLNTYIVGKYRKTVDRFCFKGSCRSWPWDFWQGSESFSTSRAPC
jgi:hypothetical protein